MKKLYIKFREHILHGGFNIPSEKEIDDAPLIVPNKKVKSAISEDRITFASESSQIEPFEPIRTKGFRAWLKGSFNNPKT